MENMKNYLFAMLAITGFIASCQNNSNTKDVSESITEKRNVTSNTKECYLYIKNKDTVSLTLNKVGNDVTGDLTYNLYEKDRNYGTITGKMKGDTLLLNYTFDSEGVSSVRQLAFLKKDNQLIEGFGPEEEKNGTMVFKKLSDLKYDPKSIVLSKTTCK